MNLKLAGAPIVLKKYKNAFLFLIIFDIIFTIKIV